jgi:hypothetical protein
MTSSIQPGWYDDPEAAGAQRYWDGQAWTPHRRRAPQSPAPSAAPTVAVPSAPPPTAPDAAASAATVAVPYTPPPAAPAAFPPPTVRQAPSVPLASQPTAYTAQPSSNPGVNVEAAPIPQQPPPQEGGGQYVPPPPGQWVPPGPQPPAVPPKAGRSGLKMFLIVAAVLAVLGGGAAVVFWKPGLLHQETKKVAVAQVQTDVQKILVDRVTGYTSGDISNVTCNGGQDPTVKQGGSFTCDVTDRGKKHQLKVTFLDNNGTYEVGLPQLSGGK